MKMSISHPYKDNILLRFGQFTQVVGQDQQLKYYIWQILLWYFGGKKYSEEDLVLFEQNEPRILIDDKATSRSEFVVIQISNINDLIEQMEYKKGTVAYDYMKKKITSMEIMEQIENINDNLDRISLLLNQKLNLQIDDIIYHTEAKYFNMDQLIQKNFLPYFGQNDKNISFEFVDNKTKFLLFLSMLEAMLMNSDEKVLLVLRNMDDYLSYNEFVNCCEKMELLTNHSNSLYIVSFPSNEGYLHVTKEVLEEINIVSDYVDHFYSLEFMYERFINQYPINQIPNEQEFLTSLRKVGAYLFSSDILHMSLSIEDQVTLKILNILYQYEMKTKFRIEAVNPMLLKYLKE
ncbi:CRISPR-associated protein Csn2-St [Streptococcus gordonii]|uniref:CRISPR-associated protein Csn2-St n=1 Tax=Streptococcus gordonii TaxID=1302 RepID=UPI00077933E4|nr:CRISPR-associated protein Csn2-St [Streptococcus gordonii]VTT25672.1 CRISPR-associated protein Cas7 [Streptococcus gordonii]